MQQERLTAGGPVVQVDSPTAVKQPPIRWLDPANLKIDTTYTTGVALGDPGAGGRSVEWLDKSFDHLYVPADHAGEWIWNREARIPTTFFSEEAKAEAIKYQQSQAGEPSSTGELLRAPGETSTENSGCCSPAWLWLKA